MSSQDIGNMANLKQRQSRPKVIRVVTAPYIVPWHMANTLHRIGTDFDTTVVGQQVTFYAESYPDIGWIDINLTRRINILSDIRSLLALCRTYRRLKPDIVHSIMPKAGLLAAIAGFVCRVPVRIHTFTGQIWATQNGPARIFYYWIDKLINSLNTICLTDSPSQSAFLLIEGISAGEAPLPVLSKGSLSGVDMERFNATLLREPAAALRFQLGLRPDDFVFAYIARKSHDKGATDILRAFAVVKNQFSNARLLYVGPDESSGELERLRKTAPHLFDKVVDVGQVKNQEVYLAASDVLCLPSYREGFGSIVIDAAALGVPTIGSRISGLVDSVEDGVTGELFRCSDIDALTQVMSKFLRNPDKTKYMGARASSRVASYFTADLLYDALKSLYLDSIGIEVKQKARKHSE